jgi:murein DD-endopeptidase MepM/ murein hydrolase activator NlpD
MLFDTDRKWWSPRGTRASTHEGVDLCLIHRPDRDPQPLPEDTPVLAPAGGRIAAMFPDFLGQTVLLSHGLNSSRDHEWFSLLAHIRPHPDLECGMPVKAGSALGWTMRFTRPPGMLCHLHFSLGLFQTRGDYDLSWPELTRRKRVSFFDPLPLLPITAEIWDNPDQWFAFVDHHFPG